MKLSFTSAVAYEVVGKDASLHKIPLLSDKNLLTSDAFVKDCRYDSTSGVNDDIVTKKWFVCAKGPIRRLAIAILNGLTSVSATLNKYDCYFYLCHIKENIILPIPESIKVIPQT